MQDKWHTPQLTRARNRYAWAVLLRRAELLVVCELRLYEVKLLLAHDGWHLGDGDPLLWRSEGMSPTPSSDRGQWRVPLMRRCDSAAPDVDRSRVDRIGHNSPHTSLIPAGPRPLGTGHLRRAINRLVTPIKLWPSCK